MLCLRRWNEIVWIENEKQLTLKKIVQYHANRFFIFFVCWWMVTHYFFKQIGNKSTYGFLSRLVTPWWSSLWCVLIVYMSYHPNYTSQSQLNSIQIFWYVQSIPNRFTLPSPVHMNTKWQYIVVSKCDWGVEREENKKKEYFERSLVGRKHTIRTQHTQPPSPICQWKCKRRVTQLCTKEETIIILSPNIIFYSHNINP